MDLLLCKHNDVNVLFASLRFNLYLKLDGYFMELFHSAVVRRKADFYWLMDVKM